MLLEIIEVFGSFRPPSTKEPAKPKLALCGVSPGEDRRLTDKFADALVFAEALHRRQTRKGNDVPYVAHLMAVAATVLEWGGDGVAAIAALLHDVAEDQGGLPTAERIRDRFGPGWPTSCSPAPTASARIPRRKRPGKCASAITSRSFRIGR